MVRPLSAALKSEASKKEMSAKVVLATRSTNDTPPIITMHLHYPRCIHSEIMTHRVFSRNARSSRAVPIPRMIAEVRDKPFIPWHWGKNQKGMQASEECNEQVEVPDRMSTCMVDREKAWIDAAESAADFAESFMRAGYHKQIVNRLLEPFMWIDTLITSTSWQNFFHLRDHDDAEPHFHDLAKLTREAINGAEYQTLSPGQWHIPYVKPEELLGGIETGLKLSVARCARISYAPFDGNASIDAELGRYDTLLGDPMHASPFEHQAKIDEVSVAPMTRWGKRMPAQFDCPELSGNFHPGYIQYRKTLPNEYVEDYAG